MKFEVHPTSGFPYSSAGSDRAGHDRSSAALPSCVTPSARRPESPHDANAEGALRFTEYDYFQEQVVKFIVMKRGLVSAPESDREFTDWNALAGFLDEFLQMAVARNPSE